MKKNMELVLDRNYTKNEFFQIITDIRKELHDGYIYVMAGVGHLHNMMTLSLAQLYSKIFNKFENNYYYFFPPFDVVLSETDIVQPDFGIVCDKTKVVKQRVVNNGIVEEIGRIEGCPDFIVEIISPNGHKRDYVEKFSKYEKYGVEEYWIINPKALTINIYLLKNGKYDDGECISILEDKTITIKSLDMELNIKEIFKEWFVG